MKQNLALLLIFVVLIAVLAALNAVSHQQKEKTPDSEMMPNRSSFNSGPTGTQAWYSLLAETGRRTMRWQQSPSALPTTSGGPNVFVVVGSLRREISDEDSTALLRWVSEGGLLVVIDRAPPDALTVTTSAWRIALDEPRSTAIFTVDPADQGAMTAETAAVKPAQPSVLSDSVNAIQPSRFAASILLQRLEGGPDTRDDDGSGAIDDPGMSAPVVHFPLGDDGLVADVPFGNGRIVFVADPYIVSNGGIGLADNSQLAVNLVDRKDAVIAFDEYHQGYGSDNNRLWQFFAGTPVVAIFLQGLFLAGLVLYSRSRRFARPLPAPEEDRLSKLEYVAAMAELQRRTKAYDLAIENVYAPARIRICRVLGLDPMTARPEDIAALAAERSGESPAVIESTLFKCEEIIRGEATSQRDTIQLIA